MRFAPASKQLSRNDWPSRLTRFSVYALTCVRLRRRQNRQEPFSPTCVKKRHRLRFLVCGPRRSGGLLIGAPRRSGGFLVDVPRSTDGLLIGLPRRSDGFLVGALRRSEARVDLFLCHSLDFHSLFLFAVELYDFGSNITVYRPLTERNNPIIPSQSATFTSNSLSATFD